MYLLRPVFWRCAGRLLGGLVWLGWTAGCGPDSKGPVTATNTAPRMTAVTSNSPGSGGTAPLPQLGHRGNAIDQLKTADEWIAQGKTNEAVVLYAKLALENPDDEEVHFSRGFFLAKLGRNSEAIACYEAALRLVPDYAEVQNNLANLLVKEQRLQDAVPHFEAAIAKSPDNASYYNNLGTAYARLGRIPDAIPHFNRAVQIDAEYPEAWFNLGRSFSQVGKYEEAVRPLQTALRLRPNLAPAQMLLREVQQKLSSQKP